MCSKNTCRHILDINELLRDIEDCLQEFEDNVPAAVPCDFEKKYPAVTSWVCTKIVRCICIGPHLSVHQGRGKRTKTIWDEPFSYSSLTEAFDKLEHNIPGSGAKKRRKTVDKLEQNHPGSEPPKKRRKTQ